MIDEAQLKDALARARLKKYYTSEGLSQEAVDKLLLWHDQYIQKTERPTWDEYYLGLAFKVAEKSVDCQTKCGCVIVDKDKLPVSYGFNGFMRDIDDAILPNIRPEKYPFMLHSELNAILLARRSVEGCTAYITGPPCNHCFQCMYQAGISEIVYANRVAIMTTDKDTQTIYEILQWLTKHKMKVRQVDFTQ